MTSKTPSILVRFAGDRSPLCSLVVSDLTDEPDHRYKGMYDDGPYLLRQRRLKKLVQLGIVDDSVVPHKVETTTQGVGEWDGLTLEEKRLSSRAMEAYAGMVDSIDVNVGKVVDYLKRTGEYDNTFIVFMSDNGAEGAACVPLIPLLSFLSCLGRGILVHSRQKTIFHSP